MYIVYLDESGSPNGWNNRQDHFVIGGVAIHESRIQTISESIDRIQTEFFSDISVPIKFHATDVSRGFDRFRNLTETQRQNLMDDVFNVLASVEYPCAIPFATAIHIS